MRLDSTAGGSSTVPANGIPCHCEERSNEAILTSIKIASPFPISSIETRLSSAYLLDEDSHLYY